MVRCHLAEARIGKDVGAADHALAAEGRREQGGGARVAQALEGCARRARQREEHEGVAGFVGDVVEEGAEARGAELRRGIGHGLQQRLQLEVGREGRAGLVEHLEDARLVPQCLFAAPLRCDVTEAEDAAEVLLGDDQRLREALDHAAVREREHVVALRRRVRIDLADAGQELLRVGEVLRELGEDVPVIRGVQELPRHLPELDVVLVERLDLARRIGDDDAVRGRFQRRAQHRDRGRELRGLLLELLLRLVALLLCALHEQQAVGLRTLTPRRARRCLRFRHYPPPGRAYTVSRARARFPRPPIR